VPPTQVPFGAICWAAASHPANASSTTAARIIPRIRASIVDCIGPAKSDPCRSGPFASADNLQLHRRTAATVRAPLRDGKNFRWPTQPPPGRLAARHAGASPARARGDPRRDGPAPLPMSWRIKATLCHCTGRGDRPHRCACSRSHTSGRAGDTAPGHRRSAAPLAHAPRCARERQRHAAGLVTLHQVTGDQPRRCARTSARPSSAAPRDQAGDAARQAIMPGMEPSAVRAQRRGRLQRPPGAASVVRRRGEPVRQAARLTALSRFPAGKSGAFPIGAGDVAATSPR
jgi:hypothetical protein